MPVEIEEAQLANFKAMEALMARLTSNPKTKRSFEKLAKEVNPQAITTEDIAAPYVNEVKEEIKPVLEWMETMKKQIGDYNYNQSVDGLRKQGYTTEGIKAIEEIATQRKVDMEMAAAFFDKTRPVAPVAPNGITPSQWNFRENATDDKDDMDLLWKNDDAFLDKVAGKASREWALMQENRQ